MNTRLAMILIASAWCGSAQSADLENIMADCNGCHGDNGVSSWSDVPTIGGLDAFVHSEALYIYRDGERPCADSEYRQGDTSRPATSMCAVAEGLSDDEIEEVAEAYAALPYVRAQQEFDSELAAAGKMVHEEHCEKCHSAGGTDPADEAGLLGGQQMTYLENQFADYASGAREQPNKMKEKMDALSADDVKALLNYYASLQ